MKLREIIAATANVTAAVNPALGAVVGLVNTFLPDDEKLSVNATGGDVQNKIDKLPIEQRTSLLEREIDLRIAQEEGWTARFVAMAQADQQSTRPRIALAMSRVLVFEICAFTVWAFVYPAQMGDPGLWTAFGTLTGVPAGVLLSYFGTLRKEQQARTMAVSGIQPVTGIAGLLQSIARR